MNSYFFNLKEGRAGRLRKLIRYLAGAFVGIMLAVGCTRAPVLSLTPTSDTTPQRVETVTPVRIDLNEELYIRQIREGVFVVTHAFPWPANSLIVEMANSDIVLIGTPYTPAAMTEVLIWIGDHFGKRKIIAINTGYHVDNLGGNSTLIEQGIPVYGSDLTVQLLKERGEQTRQMLLEMLTGAANESYYKAQTEIPYVAPTQLFPIADGLTLSFGDEQLEVYYPGPSQAPDKIVVYFPNKKVLFGGCMILGGDGLGNIADADLKNWPEALQQLKQFDVEIVVPGHGDRLDVGLIEHTITLLTPEH